MDRKQADSLGDGAGKVEGLSQKAEKEFMGTDNSGVIAQPGQGCGGGRVGGSGRGYGGINGDGKW